MCIQCYNMAWHAVQLCNTGNNPCGCTAMHFLTRYQHSGYRQLKILLSVQCVLYSKVQEYENHTDSLCITHFIIGQLTQLIHWISNGSVCDAFDNQCVCELSLYTVNIEHIPGRLGS